MYEGARPCKALNVTSSVLKTILYFTGSQWRDARIGVMWDLWLVLVNSLAAAFCTMYLLSCRRGRAAWLRKKKGYGLVIQDLWLKALIWFLQCFRSWKKPVWTSLFMCGSKRVRFWSKITPRFLEEVLTLEARGPIQGFTSVIVVD